MRTTCRRSTAVLEVHGDLDAGSAPLLQRRLRALLRDVSGLRAVELDVAGVRCVDAAGVQALVRGNAIAHASGRTLVVANPPPCLVRRLHAIRPDARLHAAGTA